MDGDLGGPGPATHPEQPAADPDHAPGTTRHLGSGARHVAEGPADTVPGGGRGGERLVVGAHTDTSAPAPGGTTGDTSSASGSAPRGPGLTEPVSTERRLLGRLLGEDRLLLGATAHDRLWGWLGPLLVTVLAGVARFANLGRPHALVFDETYYVKQAYTLLKVGYEARWPDNPNPAFEAGHLNTFLSQADYAVHPPVGKWLIAFGMQLFGPASSFGWRFSVAVAGTLAVWMVARIARRLFASTALGVIAGGLFAVDGEAIVHSRTGLLDQFVMFFALAAFGALLLDREQSRRRLAAGAARVIDAGGEVRWSSVRLGVRWWRVTAAVLLGLSIGTKWSGIYFLAVFGVLSVAWDLTARRAVGQRRWALTTLTRDAVPAGLAMTSIAFATYMATWTVWFRTPGAYMRQWAVQNPGEGVQWLPPALRSLLQYHADMWHFHNTLQTPHPYAASPLGWLVQWQPTSMYYPESVSGLDAQASQALCGSDRCSQAITSLGNPLIWWAATAAIVVALVWLVRRYDWRAGAVLVGIGAGWVPWLGYAHRTIFTFYSIAFAPWMVLTLTYVIGIVLGTRADSARRRRAGRWWVGGFLVLVVAVSVFFYPIWTAQVVPYWFWRLHMWLPSWI